MLHNFGGNISLFGRIEGVAGGPSVARMDKSSGKMNGIGLTMEGIEQNPVLYELMTDHTWRTDPIDLDTWLPEYVHDRYGSKDTHAIKAWDILRRTVYNGNDIRDGAESILAARPTLESERRWVKTKLNYTPFDLIPAWDEMILASPACQKYDGFQYDLADVTRQILANYALVIHSNIVKAYHEKNYDSLRVNCNQFLSLLDDLDRLLATRKDFLLGPWIEQARDCGSTLEEKALYERNARNLITLWGGENNRLHEYSCRQWSGLISSFYRPRWKQFFDKLDDALRNNTTLETGVFEQHIKKWEWNWVNTQGKFPVNAKGDVLTTVVELQRKYRPKLINAYKM
jgi:alpha-N-acetylglucosaminidase